MKCIGHEKVSVEDIKVGKWYNFHYEYDNPVYVTGLKRNSEWYGIGGHDGVPESIIEGNVMFTVYVHTGAYVGEQARYFGEFPQGLEVEEWVMTG